MKDHEIRELVNQLQDIAIKYHGAGQLREQIARVVRPAMLQAGNSPVIPADYVMVPREPTAKMIWAGKYAMHSTVGWASFKAVYIAMLAAAPQEVR